MKQQKTILLKHKQCCEIKARDAVTVYKGYAHSFKYAKNLETKDKKFIFRQLYGVN